MSKINIFGYLIDIKELIVLVAIVLLLIVLVVLFIFEIKVLLERLKYSREIKQFISESEDDDDEIEEFEEETNSSMDSKIRCPRRMNLRLRLNASSDGLKERYSKLRNHLETYKLRHNFLKHRDVYYVEEEVISKDEQGNMMNKSVSRKVAMITIRKKQLILSLNINLDAVKYVPQIVQDNIVIEERRYDGYNLNLRITTKQDMKDALKLINMLLAQLKVKELLSEKEWNQLYMGGDGQFTMFIDSVSKTFSKSSTTPINERKEMLADIKPMFDIIVNS